MDTQTLLLLLVAIPVIFYIIVSFGQKKVPDNTIISFTGGLGSGKTFLAVKYAVRDHRRKLIKHYVNKLTKIFYKKHAQRPAIYSNIPVRVWGKTWAHQLQYEHIVGTKRLPDYCTIIFDELGMTASQWSYDHPMVRQHLDRFIRLFRHWTDGRLYITDQNSSNIVVNIRRRINQIYHLSDFKRYLGFFYKVNVSEIMITEDMMTVQQTTETNELPYFFGLLPFKILELIGFKRKYDSRCYSITYTAPEPEEITTWQAYKTDYEIELPNDPELQKIFKQRGYLTKRETMALIEKWRNRNEEGLIPDK
jgi:hypothetical protein